MRPSIFPRALRAALLPVALSAAPLAAQLPSPAPAQPAAAPAPSAVDQQIVQVLTAAYWCALDYKGGGGGLYSGMPTYTRSTEYKALFGRDGALTVATQSEASNLSDAGGAVSNQSNVQQFRWKVQNAQLWVAANGGPFQVLPAQLAPDGMGSVVLQANGLTWKPCR